MVRRISQSGKWGLTKKMVPFLFLALTETHTHTHTENRGLIAINLTFFVPLPLLVFEREDEE